MKKITDFKFGRDSRFTPSDLSESELSEIESASYAFVSAIVEQGLSAHGLEKYSNDFQLASDMRPDYLQFHGFDQFPSVLFPESAGNESGWKYAKTCVNFLIVCGSKSGLWFLRSQATNRTYAMAQGYYG